MKQMYARYSERHVWHGVWRSTGWMSGRDWNANCTFRRYFDEKAERTTKPRGRMCKLCARRKP